MYERRDALVDGAKIVTELENLAYEKNSYMTGTNIRSGPWGTFNIQSDVRLAFCLMHKETTGLEAMGTDIESRVKSIAALHGLKVSMERDVHLSPGDFWSEAVNFVNRACGDEGIASRMGTFHDSTMTTTLVPTAMVFVRGKDGISHSPKEWSLRITV